MLEPNSFAWMLAWAIVHAMYAVAATIGAMIVIAVVWFALVRLGWIPAPKGTTQSTGPR